MRDDNTAPNASDGWQTANHAWQKWLDANIPDWDAMPNIDLTTLPTPQEIASNNTTKGFWRGFGAVDVMMLTIIAFTIVGAFARAIR